MIEGSVNEPQKLIRFAKLAFSFVFEEAQVERFIKNQIKVDESEEQARKWIRKQLKKAPNNAKTRLKNAIHRMNAVALVSRN